MLPVSEELEPGYLNPSRFGPSAWTGLSHSADDILNGCFGPTFGHYNRARPHRGLALQTPIGNPWPGVGDLRAGMFAGETCWAVSFHEYGAAA
jgi:hypothetical protein